MQYTDLVGQMIFLVIPQLDPVKLQHVKLHGVETGGLWIHSQEYTNTMLSQFGVASTPKTMVIFLPYHAITVGFASIDEPSLNEKAFGV